MPSSTFFNLEKEKQTKLISNSLKEFANKKYHEVSINKIIANSNIPRGSFYMYFKDKEDLFEYLIELNTKEINKIIKNLLIANNGDLYHTFKMLFEEITKKYYKEEAIGIFKNIFIFKSLRNKPVENPHHDLFLDIKDNINTTNLKNVSLEFIFTMLMHSLFLSIEEFSLTKNYDKTKIKYFQKLDILCYGIYKEGD